MRAPCRRNHPQERRTIIGVDVLQNVVHEVQCAMRAVEGGRQAWLLAARCRPGRTLWPQCSVAGPCLDTTLNVCWTGRISNGCRRCRSASGGDHSTSMLMRKATVVAHGVDENQSPKQCSRMSASASLCMRLWRNPNECGVPMEGPPKWLRTIVAAPTPGPRVPCCGPSAYCMVDCPSVTRIARTAIHVEAYNAIPIR